MYMYIFFFPLISEAGRMPNCHPIKHITLSIKVNKPLVDLAKQLINKHFCRV